MPHKYRTIKRTLGAGIALALFGVSFVAGLSERKSQADQRMRPGHPDWPMVWSTYHQVTSLEEDIKDLKAHGVGLISRDCRTVAQAAEALDLARRTGMKYHISLPEITEQAPLVEKAGLEPVPAIMIGGVYQGKAIDRHLFSFTPMPHRIIIEPPVYNKDFAYTRGSGATGQAKRTERIAHYFPDMGSPLRAEVVLPLQPFDGRQHLKILPATITTAPAGARPEFDSVTPDMDDSSETKNRVLYQMEFDLTGLDKAILDQVGLAVYWEYPGSGQYWMFGRGNVSAWAPSTQKALTLTVREHLSLWIEANGGTFPHDVVLAARLGDECFYATSHLNGPAVSYPLWEYSKPSIERFLARAGEIEYPRTWGFPEVYGPDAYAWWLYTLHEGCARLCGIAREEIARTAPGLLLFRNTTRMGVFHKSNDHDGSGQELLAKNLDIVHLDPYPVSTAGYGPAIPRDMSYCAGLARRHARLLIPWMQAHTYGALGHVSPEDVDRMAEEQWVHGPDAVIWLGYGETFPQVRPDSWNRAGQFHQRLADSPPAKPQVEMAVLRPYRTWAASSRWRDQIRNPADWMLQQFLEVWAVKYEQPYDVFELPPAYRIQHDSLATALKQYSMVVSTEPYDGAWIIGEGTKGTAIDPATARQLQARFENELKSRGWLKR